MRHQDLGQNPTMDDMVLFMFVYTLISILMMHCKQACKYFDSHVGYTFSEKHEVHYGHSMSLTANIEESYIKQNKCGPQIENALSKDTYDITYCSEVISQSIEKEQV